MSAATFSIRTRSSGHNNEVESQDCGLTSEVADDLDREYDADEIDFDINTGLHHIIQHLDSVQLNTYCPRQQVPMTETSPSEIATSLTTLALDHAITHFSSAQLQFLILEKQRNTLEHVRQIAAHARSIQASVFDIKELARYLPANGTPYDDYCTHMQSSCDFFSSSAQDPDRFASQIRDLPTNTETMTLATQFGASAQDMLKYARHYERYPSGLRAHAKYWEEEYSQRLDRR